MELYGIDTKFDAEFEGLEEPMGEGDGSSWPL